MLSHCGLRRFNWMSLRHSVQHCAKGLSRKRLRLTTRYSFAVLRETLAKGAGTSTSRVAVHALHQHDAPGFDLSEIELLAPLGIESKACNVPFVKDVLKRLEAAVKGSLATARPFTHIGTGQAKVDRVASNRRILGDDGKVKIVRLSSTKDPDAIAAPEGVIDPELKLLSFWNGDVPLISITFYATHPQSHYGKGDVSSYFVGLIDSSVPQAMVTTEQVISGPQSLTGRGATKQVSSPARHLRRRRC